MTQTELGTILHSIDSALEVFRRHQGPLTATQVSMKSMLATLRAQVMAELSLVQNSQKLAAEPN